MKTFFPVGLALLILTLQTGCSETPVPPEVQLAISQEQDLWRAGATVYAQKRYADFVVALQASRAQLSAEQSRLVWLRDYDRVATDFRAVLALGKQVLRETEQNKAQQTDELFTRTSQITVRLRALRDLVSAVKDSRLNTGSLSRIEILLTEAGSFAKSNHPDLALARLAEAEILLNKTVDVIRPVLAQYIDATQISRWKSLVDDVVAESRRHGGYAIVVNKLRRQLILYNKGAVVATYPVGLGFNTIGDKLLAGDRTTPEGRYQVISKTAQKQVLPCPVDQLPECRRPAALCGSQAQEADSGQHQDRRPDRNSRWRQGQRNPRLYRSQ